MFVRTQTNGSRTYLLIVDNEWVDGKVMVLDSNGNPVCSELWPGNTADVKSLVPIVERLRKRFGIGSVSIVAHRGMIGAETLAEVERRKWSYILGVRMRSSTEAKAVVARAGRYAEVCIPRATTGTIRPR